MEVIDNRHRTVVAGVVSRSPGRKSGRTMRIAQIAPLHESIPSQLYGSTERIVGYVTEELCSNVGSACSA
jgi:hypothetical protein